MIGTFLQLGVLIYAGFATYYHTLKFPKEENRPVSNYAFPCTASGTIVLATGLLLCADVVEKRTAEEARKPATGYEAYPIWVQRQATVGDQVFKSFGIFSKTSRKEVLTSRRNTLSKTQTEVSLVDRTVEVVCYIPLQIVELFKKALNKQTSSSTENSVQSSKTTLGSFLSISGYVVQFVGLRDMHWSVSIIQLGAVVFMTAARAAIRRGLAVPPNARSLAQNFELEWLASTLAGTDGFRWEVSESGSSAWTDWVVLGDEGIQLQSPDDTRDSAESHTHSSNQQNQGVSQEDIVKDYNEESEDDSEDDSEEDRGREDIKNSPEESSSGNQSDTEAQSKVKNDNSGDIETNNGIEAADGQRSGSVTESRNEGHANTVCSKSHNVMALRSHFAKVTGWQSPVFAEASSLSRAIEVVMNTLFLNNRLEHFNWALRATYNNSEPQVINVSLSLINGNWQIHRHHVEAILSLWIFSLQNVRKDENTNQNEDTTTDGPGVHLLGTDTPQLRRDLRWWVPRDLKKAILVREGPEGSLVVEKALVVGYGRATPTKVKLERIQLDEDDDEPPYGQAMEHGFLAIESFRPPASLYALDLFSSFMKAVARTMDEPIQGQGEIRPNDSGNLGSWTSFTLHNTLLSKMAGEIQGTGLAPLSEVYSAIIPSLSIKNKLPLVDNIVELAREHARPHEERGDMKKATEVYIWLIKTARLFPSDTSFVAKSTAVILDQRDQLINSIKLSDRLRPIASPLTDLSESRIKSEKGRGPKETPLRQQIDNELQLGEPESRSFLIRLMLLYDDQCRLDILPSQFAKIADHDPTFLRLRRSILSSPPREYEEGTEKRDITGWTQLHRDAAAGKEFELSVLLKDDIDPDTRDLLGQTALHLACQAGKVETATILARNGADINAKTRNWSTPLHYAARQGDLSIVRLIVESGAEFDAMDSVRMTPAMWAALEGKKSVLSYLWKNSNLNLRDFGGRAVLHHAVLSGCCGVVDVFEKGIDAEVRDHEGRTPLQLAVLHGNEDAFSILRTKLQADMGALDNGGNHLLHLAAVGEQMAMMNQLAKSFDSDVNCKDNRHETPLHLVVRECKDTSIEALIELKANLEARNISGETPLMIACRLNRIKIIQQLISFGANIDTTTNSGDSVLITAVIYGHRKVVEYLLQTEVDIDNQDRSGRTALHTAARFNRRKIIELLIDAGAKKEKPDNDGRTPLHGAAEGGYSAVTKLLLVKGADKDARDSEGMTPLHHAACKTGIGVLRLLNQGRKPFRTIGQIRDAVDRELERIVKLLLEAGAERQTANKEGKTARQLAEGAGKQRLVEMIDTIQAKSQ